MNEFIETIDLDFAEEDLLAIEKLYGGASANPVPAVCVMKEGCYFNKKAGPSVPEHIRWFVNDEWVVLKPGRKDDRNSYGVWPIKSIPGAKHCRLPKQLEGAATFRGVHKLYKTKDGLAFKKNEILE